MPKLPTIQNKQCFDVSKKNKLTIHSSSNRKKEDPYYDKRICLRIALSNSNNFLMRHDDCSTATNLALPIHTIALFCTFIHHLKRIFSLKNLNARYCVTFHPVNLGVDVSCKVFVFIQALRIKTL